jgi:hypothetical protein
MNPPPLGRSRAEAVPSLAKDARSARLIGKGVRQLRRNMPCTRLSIANAILCCESLTTAVICEVAVFFGQQTFTGSGTPRLREDLAVW